MGGYSVTNTNGFEGDLDMKQNKITNVGDATVNTDAISRGYGD